jgi:polysaccharide biosynthesis/export protein
MIYLIGRPLSRLSERCAMGSALRGGCAGVLLLLAGCASARPQIEAALQQPPNVADALAAYRLACPDVIRVEVRGRPDWSGEHQVGADGRIDLGPLGQHRVEGLTVAEATRQVADRAGLEREGVALTVAEHRSRRVFFTSGDTQRAVEYRGPETVVDLLRRAGGLAPGASALHEVYVVRPHVARDQSPEVFTVDLEAILLDHDGHSNVRLEPGDQVYVGASRRANFHTLLPRWLRPTWRALCGMSWRG